MRHVVFVMLLCSCASLSPKGRILTAAEIEANYKEFYKELTFEDEEIVIGINIDHFVKAKGIADKKKVDRKRVISAVTTVMWNKVLLTKEIGVGTAKDISKLFELDRATETAFAQKVFDFLNKNSFCEIAADVVYHFDIGLAYADKAILCAQTSATTSYVPVAQLACRRPGTKGLQSKLIKEWVENFKGKASDRRKFIYFWVGVGSFSVDDYESMAKIAAMCPLTNEQLSDLFAIGIKDKKIEFAKVFLDKENFKKTPADYDNFIALAVADYQCGMAANVALKYKVGEKRLENIFLNHKCLGGTLGEIDRKLILPAKAEWFFDLSLKAHEFLLARRIVKDFSLGKDFFDKVMTEGLKVFDYGELLLLEPWGEERVQDHRDSILEKILDANEEWSLVQFVSNHSSTADIRPFTENQRIVWTERAFLHALRRGGYDLASDIAHSDSRTDFREWGVKLAFDVAMKARNADMARYIAKRYKLDNNAHQRVAMLYFELNKEKDMEKAKQRKEKLRSECKASKDWNAQQCK